MKTNQKRANGKGSAIFLKGNRENPWGARITIGTDENGIKIRHFIDYFKTELDALVFLENYHKEPYPIYIKESIYNRIVKFPKTPYPLVAVANPNKDIVIRTKKDNYTYKQVYELFYEINMPTQEEIDLEKSMHIRPKGKIAYHHSRAIITQYNKCTELYDRVYKELKKSDFQKIVNQNNKTSDSAKTMITFFKKLDDCAMEEEIIDKPQSLYLKNTGTYTPPKKKKPFTYEEIQMLWDMQPETKEEEFIRDYYLIGLYCGARPEELFFIYTKNIHLDEDYFVGGLKTGAGINRKIPIHKDIKHLFIKYYNPENEFLFMNSKGSRLRYASYRIWHKEIKEKYPFLKNHTAHECRHTLRSEMDRLGINDVIINLIIGHKSDDVGKEVYTHKELEELQAAINLVTYKKHNNLHILKNQKTG